MTNENGHPDSPVREELTAYLDGELDADHSRAVEDRIATDDSYRRELQSLDRAWTALNELPRATVDESFTKSTIEMAAVEAERDLATTTASAPRRRRRRWTAIAAACIAAAAVGFVFTRAVATRSDHMLVAQLPVIWQLDALSQFQDVDFLSRLQEGGRTRRVLDTIDRERVNSDLADWQTIGNDAPDVGSIRADWIRQLPPDKQAQLKAKAERFERMSTEKQNELTSRYEALRQAADPVAAQRAALAYYAWVGTLPEGQQASLRRSPTEERLHELEREVRQNGRPLSEDDEAKLWKALEKLEGAEVLAWLPGLAEQSAREDRGRRGGGGRDWGRDRNEWLSKPVPNVFFTAVLADYISRRGGPPFRPMFLNLERPEQLETVREEARAQWAKIEPLLLEPLADDAKAFLAPLSAEDRAEQIVRWITSAMPEYGSRGDLQAQFQDLDESRLPELLSQPLDELIPELMRRSGPGGWRGGDEGGPPNGSRRRGDGGGGPRDDRRGRRGGPPPDPPPGDDLGPRDFGPGQNRDRARERPESGNAESSESGEGAPGPPVSPTPVEG